MFMNYQLLLLFMQAFKASDVLEFPYLCSFHCQKNLEVNKISFKEFTREIEDKETILLKRHVDQISWLYEEVPSCQSCNESTSEFYRFHERKFINNLLKTIIYKFLDEKYSSGTCEYLLYKFDKISIGSGSMLCYLSDLSLDYDTLVRLKNIFVDSITNPYPRIICQLENIQKCIEQFEKNKDKSAKDLFNELIETKTVNNSSMIFYYLYMFNEEFYQSLNSLELCKLIKCIAINTKYIGSHEYECFMSNMLFHCINIKLAIEDDHFNKLAEFLIENKCCDRLEIIIVQQEYSGLLSKNHILIIIKQIVERIFKLKSTNDFLSDSENENVESTNNDGDDDLNLLMRNISISNPNASQRDHSSTVSQNNENSTVNQNDQNSTPVQNDSSTNQNDALELSYENSTYRVNQHRNDDNSEISFESDFSAHCYEYCDHFKGSCNILPLLLTYGNIIKPEGYLEIASLIFSLLEKYSNHKKIKNLIFVTFFKVSEFENFKLEHLKCLFELFSKHNIPCSKMFNSLKFAYFNLKIDENINECDSLFDFVFQLPNKSILLDIFIKLYNDKSLGNEKRDLLIDYAIDQYYSGNIYLINLLIKYRIFGYEENLSQVREKLKISVDKAIDMAILCESKIFENFTKKEINLFFDSCFVRKKYYGLAKLIQFLDSDQIEKVQNSRSDVSFVRMAISEFDTFHSFDCLLDFLNLPIFYHGLPELIVLSGDIDCDEFYWDIFMKNIFENPLFSEYYYKEFKSTGNSKMLDNPYMRNIILALLSGENLTITLKTFIKYLSDDQKVVAKALIIHNIMNKKDYPYDFDSLNTSSKDILCNKIMAFYKNVKFDTSKDKLEFIFKNFSHSSLQFLHDKYYSWFEMLVNGVDYNELMDLIEKIAELLNDP